jgi:Domain of unknown function (DUF4123)
MEDTQTMPAASQISERLFNAGLQYDSVYLLLDRFTEYPLQESIDSLPDASALCWPLQDALFATNPQQSPLLVQLQRSNPDHQAILLSSIQLALAQSGTNLRSVCAWIYTNTHPKQLQNALSQRLKAHWPGNQAIYLRYFDPRVMPRLMHILPPEQQAQLLGPVHTWCQLGRDGQWLTHHHPSADLPTSLISGLRPSTSNTQAIDRIELVNLTAKELARQGHAVPHSQDESLDNAVQAAQKLGITSADDTVAYAWRAMLHKNTFTNHSALADHINTAITNGLPLDSLLAEHLNLETT